MIFLAATVSMVILSSTLYVESIGKTGYQEEPQYQANRNTI
jgi:hypothetical protein